MKKLLLLFWLIAAPAFGAPTFDAVDSASGGTVSSLSFSLTVGGGCTNPIIVVDVHWTDNGSSTITALTIGGASATLIDMVHLVEIGNRWIASYRRVGVSTGSNAIAITMSGTVTASISGMARSYCGVDQTTPTGTAAQANGDTAGPAQSTVSSAADELVISAAQVRNETFTGVGTTQTERYNDTDGRAGSDKAGASSVTMQHTLSASSQWGIISVPLKPAAGAPAVARRRLVVVQ